MLKKIGIVSLLTAMIAGIIASVPALATEATTNNGTTVAPTFSQEVSESQDLAELRFGQSLLVAGTNVELDSTTPGLLFAFGPGLTLNTHSEYAFVAGNEINFSAQTTRDLFAAGNIINILPDAKIGCDVFAAGYRVNLESDLPGSLSASASQVVLKNVKIAGNVNLTVENLSFEGAVEIAGTLIYNDDATVSGLDNVKTGAIETYTPEVRTRTVGEFWFSELTSIVSLFIAAIILFAIWSRARAEVTDDNTASKLAGNLAYGFIFLLAMPFIIILLILSFVAAPVGIIMILAYIIMIYLSQAFTAAWIGHLILAKGLHLRLPVILETLIGILVLSCLALFPGLNLFVGFLSIIFGLGMMVRCLKPKKADTENLESGEGYDKVFKSAKTKATPKTAQGAKSASKAKKTPSKQKSNTKKK